jgi:hypothetical protein
MIWFAGISAIITSINMFLLLFQASLMARADMRAVAAQEKFDAEEFRKGFFEALDSQR